MIQNGNKDYEARNQKKLIVIVIMIVLGTSQWLHLPMPLAGSPLAPVQTDVRAEPMHIVPRFAGQRFGRA